MLGGNYYFGEAYINPADIKLAEMFLPEPGHGGRKSKSDKIKWKSILPGYILDLGDIRLEVYSFAGHTPGNIALLDRKSRILFTGDGVNECEWLQLDHSLPVKKCIDELKNLEIIRSEFDYILTAHATDLADACRVEELLAGAEEVLEGKDELDSDYESFGEIVKAHPYGPKDSGYVIVYNPKKSKE